MRRWKSCGRHLRSVEATGPAALFCLRCWAETHFFDGAFSTQILRWINRFLCKNMFEFLNYLCLGLGLFKTRLRARGAGKVLKRKNDALQKQKSNATLLPLIAVLFGYGHDDILKRSESPESEY